MSEFLNKKITIAQVIEFLERCFIHSNVKTSQKNNIVYDNLSNFEFVDIDMEMPDINLEFQNITLDFADIKIEALAA